MAQTKTLHEQEERRRKKRRRRSRRKTKNDKKVAGKGSDGREEGREMHLLRRRILCSPGDFFFLPHVKKKGRETRRKG